MSTDRLPLPDILRGLILAAGLSQQETALRSGISPGSVAALCVRIPKPLLTWLRLVAALGGRLSITWQDRAWTVPMPKIAAPVVEREWASWRTRRMVTTINHLRTAAPKTKRALLEERAHAYAANEEARLRQRLGELKSAAKAFAGAHRCQGLRVALRLIATRLGLRAEELTLLSGASLSACQLALGELHDGRLATMHRLCSALGARLEITLPAGGIAIGFCPPGDWRPGMAEPTAEGEDDTPTARTPKDNQNRSSLSSAEMLALFDQGLSSGAIARQAGVSRQRVHKLAMDNGRTQRRQAVREQRVASGRELLGVS
ncbi:MAG: hypothetical protein H0X38_01640 [Planctomycetes bacterium]|nr:hypothetical protein [Planctomycetota bacterium]